MVKISAPLMSLSAKGSVAKFLTFSERKSGSQVRWQKKQKAVYANFNQNDVKSLYRLCLARWHSFSDSERLVFTNLALAQKKPMTGWNYFLNVATSNPYLYLKLLVYFNFDHIVNNRIFDLSKNSRHLDLLPSYPSNCPILANSRSPKLFKGLYFDGVNDTATLSSSLLVSSPLAFSFGFLYKQFSFENLDTQMFLFIAPTEPYFLWLNINPTTRKFFIYNWPEAFLQKTFNYTIPLNTFEHYFFTISGKTVSLYVNGVFKEAQTLSANIPYLGPNCDVGRSVYGPNNACIYDEMAFYDRVLSSGEIAEIYNRIT